MTQFINSKMGMKRRGKLRRRFFFHSSPLEVFNATKNSTLQCLNERKLIDINSKLDSFLLFNIFPYFCIYLQLAYLLAQLVVWLDVVWFICGFKMGLCTLRNYFMESLEGSWNRIGIEIRIGLLIELQKI